MGLDKCIPASTIIMSCRDFSLITESSVLCLAYSSLPSHSLQPVAIPDVLTVAIALCFPLSYSWNYIVLSLLRLASFTKKYAFESFLHVFSCLDCYFFLALHNIQFYGYITVFSFSFLFILHLQYIFAIKNNGLGPASYAMS